MALCWPGFAADAATPTTFIGRPLNPMSSLRNSSAPALRLPSGPVHEASPELTQDPGKLHELLVRRGCDQAEDLRPRDGSPTACRRKIRRHRPPCSPRKRLTICARSSGRGSSRSRRAAALAHHIVSKRGVGHQRGDIHAERASVEAVQELRKRLPVPPDPFLHRDHRDSFGSGHDRHGGFAFGALSGRQSQPALTDGQRSHAMPTRKGAVGIPIDLGVVMTMDFDRAWSNDATRSVKLLNSFGTDPSGDLGDLAIFDRKVGAE